MSREAPKKFEDYVYVLDYMAHGKIMGTRQAFRSEPLVQVIGENYFTLLEAVLQGSATISLHDRLYIGKDMPRDKVSHILGRVSYDELSSTAKTELPLAVEDIVTQNEERFVKFFNTAEAITPRMHSLELVPGIGKKYTWTILRAREQRPFASFEDIKNRAGLPDPHKLITRRILEELTEKEPKYRLFTRAS